MDFGLDGLWTIHYFFAHVAEGVTTPVITTPLVVLTPTLVEIASNFWFIVSNVVCKRDTPLMRSAWAQVVISPVIEVGEIQDATLTPKVSSKVLRYKTNKAKITNRKTVVQKACFIITINKKVKSPITSNVCFYNKIANIFLFLKRALKNFQFLILNF